MNFLARLLRQLRPLPQPEPPAPLPPGHARIHFLAATFATRDAAEAFCYDSGENAPEALTREQPGAYIDTQFVEVVFEQIADRLAEFLPPDQIDNLLANIGHDNTLIILAEQAFGGFPYTLDDSETLRYLGPVIVET